MDRILLPALEKLKKDSAGRSGHPAVKKATDEAIASLTELRQKGALDNNAQAQFPALHAAMASRVPKLMVTALDCTQKLLAFKYLGQDVASQAIVVRVVSACSEQEDDGVQLQVVKALLTAVTSGATRETSLLLAVRACYHIHLVSDNVVNRTTAKLTLTQMMDYVFSALEAEPVADVPADKARAAPPPVEDKIGLGMYPSVQALMGFDGSGSSGGVFHPRPHPGSSGSNDASPAAGPTTVEGEAKEDAKDDEHKKFNFSSAAHKDAFLLLRTLCKLAMKAISFEKLTAKGEEAADPIALKSKILSLELLQDILEKAQKRFKESDVILFAVKQYLVPGLMKNCLETNLQVARVSVSVFVAMQRAFKEQLKKEIDLFISDVFLALLDSPHAGFENRLLVLGMLSKMCGDVQLLVEIFLNYDCDWGSRDLLGGIVRGVAKASEAGLDIAHLPTTTMDILEGNKRLRVMAVTALAALAKSLAGYIYHPTPDAAGGAAAPAAAVTTTTTTKDERPLSATDAADLTATPRPGGSASAIASAALDAFQLKQTFRKDLEIAVQKFNEKPRTGLEYFRERGHIDGSPEGNAKFLLDHQDVLSKTMIGDYLGGDAEANLKTLSAYVELLDFKGIVLDEAVRQYLQGFRIPGEAQKIDRILEKFASHYWKENPDVFPSADTAFILSFAIIMLQTDAHNPNIKPERKMSKTDFMKNNRGIAAGRDLSPEFLGGIYDRIVAKAITLKDDDFDGQIEEKKPVVALDAKSKRRAFLKERAEILTDAEARAKAKTATPNDETAGAFVLVENAFAAKEHVGPMFKVVAKSLQQAFVENLRSTEDADMATLCLEGLFNAVRVAGRFGCVDELVSLIEALAVLTKLDNPPEIRPKHVMCSQALIAIALSEGDFLGPSWVRTLQCISELWRLLNANAEDEKKGRSPAEPTPTQTLKRVLDPSSIDRIFLRSSGLSEDAIVLFVQAMVTVSRVELMLEPSNKQVSLKVVRPRIFSLQKLVEVADFNMATRPRVSWGKMWATMSDHFSQSGCHLNIPVAMYAVDSLKQLSLKFLDKDEFVGFAFQERFLRPFESIALKSPSADVRALVLHCVQNIISGKARNIKSGWEAVFDTIAASGKDSNLDNVNMAFAILESTTVAPAFLRAQCALKFGSCGTLEVSDKALAIVEKFCECMFHIQPTVIDDGNEDPARARDLLKMYGAFAANDARPAVRGKAVQGIFGLVRQGIDEAPSPALVQRVVVDVLLPPWGSAVVGPEEDWSSCTLAVFGIEMLRLVAYLTCGLDANPITPDAFARVRQPMADDIVEDGKFEKLGPNEQWRREMHGYAQGGVLSNVLALMAQLSVREQANASKVGVALFHYSVDLLGNHLTSLAWDHFYDALAEALERSSSKWLLSAETRTGLGLVLPADEDELVGPRTVSLDALDALNEDSGVIVVATPAKGAVPVLPELALDVGVAGVRSATHLGLIKVLCRIASKQRPGQTQTHFLRACDLLETGLEAARSFNDDHALRLELARRGFVNPKSPDSPPDMLEHETVTSSTLLRLLDKTPDDQRFQRVLMGLVNRYLGQDRILTAEQTFKPKSKESDSVAGEKRSDAQREMSALTPIVLLALRGVLEFNTDANTDKALPWLFPLLLQLIEVPNRDVRAVVRRILERHVSRRLMA